MRGNFGLGTLGVSGHSFGWLPGRCSLPRPLSPKKRLASCPATVIGPQPIWSGRRVASSVPSRGSRCGATLVSVHLGSPSTPSGGCPVGEVCRGHFPPRNGSLAAQQLLSGPSLSGAVAGPRPRCHREGLDAGQLWSRYIRGLRALLRVAAR